MIKQSLFLLCLLSTSPLFAAPDSQGDTQPSAAATLVNQIVKAYGGSSLTGIKSYQVEDRHQNIVVGQNHTPLLQEIAHSAQNLTVDIEGNRAVYDTLFSGRGGVNQNTTISDGTSAHTINFQQGMIAEAANADRYAFAGGTMRTADAILVYELSKVVDQVTLLDDTFYLNRPHHVLTMPFPLSPELTLFIDAETYRVSKMQRQNPVAGALDYVYANYKTNNGVTYASSITFSIAGAPNVVSQRHELTFNVPVPDTLFAIPEGLAQQPDRVDTTDMRAIKLGDGVYHVGQGNGYSLFVQTPSGVVGVGGYPALPARLAKYHSESGSYQPLSHQIITHHHNDHLGGMDEAVSLGATLVTVADNVAPVKASATTSLSKQDFLLMSHRLTLGAGKQMVEVYEVSTSHAASFLVTYVPSAKTVFIADHFGTPFADVLPIANQGSVDMLAALDSLKLDIKNIATAHNSRIFTLSDLRKSVAAFQPTACAGNRPVCQ